jgi:hypothetical protein
MQIWADLVGLAGLMLWQMTQRFEQLIGLAAIMRDVTKRSEEIRALKQKLAEATKAPS